MKVYYSGNYWGGHKYEHAGNEIPIKKEFVWGGVKWYVPSVYVCAKGLVIDFCIEIRKEKFEEFVKKLDLKRRNNQIVNKKLSELRDEEIEQIEDDNPFSINIEVKAKLNSSEPSESRMCSVCWQPFEAQQEEIDDVQEELMDYYACDRSQGWKFIRVCFPWTTSRKPKLKDISLTLKEHPVGYSGKHFITDDSCNNKEITITHPVSKKVHTLILSECENKSLPEASAHFFSNEQLPNYYKAFMYSVTPDLSPNEFRIQDCARSDKPRRQKDGNAKSAADGICSCGVIGIIGGADGPTEIIVSGNYSKEPKKYIACSSLHFEPVSIVEWRTIFYIKKNDDFNLNITL